MLSTRNRGTRRLTALCLMVATGWSGPSTGHSNERSAGTATPDVPRFDAWEVYCSDDAALGQLRCHVEHGLILVVGIRRSDGTTLVDVAVTGDPPYPGGGITYRVDSNAALAWSRGDDGAGQGAMIVEQMLQGRQIEARYVAFEPKPGRLRPDRVSRKAQASLAGFAAAYAEMLRRLEVYARE